MYSHVFSYSGLWLIDCIHNLSLLVETLQRTFKSTSPKYISQNSHDFFLKCSLKGWPLPHVVWYKDGKEIINGSQGFYHKEKPGRSQCYPATLVTILHFPAPGREEYKGYYTCYAENSFNGWSSKHSAQFEVIYECKPSDLFPFINKIGCSLVRQGNTVLPSPVEVYFRERDALLIKSLEINMTDAK